MYRLQYINKTAYMFHEIIGNTNTQLSNLSYTYFPIANTRICVILIPTFRLSPGKTSQYGTPGSGSGEI